MVFMLTSCIETHIKEENGNKIAIPIPDTNQVLTNIKKYLKDTKRIVYVANNPANFEENDLRTSCFFESFELSGLNFDEKIVLDNRNIKDAKNILNGADLIILSGGKILCQLKFFKKIKLKKILKNHDGLCIGISVGTMNLGKIVANFPEELADLNEKRFVKGLGFFDKIIIPHFDGENKVYQIECNEIDVVRDYILPLSKGKSFIGLPNGSYVLVDGQNTTYFGDCYEIADDNVTKKE